MRYVYLILMLFTAFSSAAQLNDSEQKLADMMLSGDLRQLKMAAQTIEDNELSNPALLDIAAEIFVRVYPDLYTAELDTIAWLARGIGASENGRYHQILATAVDTTNSRKLARHVKKALKNIGDAEGEQYTKGMYSLPSDLYAREDESVRDARILNLITAGDLSSLRNGAKNVFDRRVQNPEILDYLAEILISYHATASDNQIEAFSWVAKALGQSKSGRYVSVLTDVDENGAHRKLRGYADDALDEHGDPQGEQYQKGMIGKEIDSYSF